MMDKELRPLSDLWLELQLVSMSADLSTDDQRRLEKLLEHLKEHVNHNQEIEQKMVLRWFTSRLSSRLFSNHYRQLLLELANLMSSIWAGSPKFCTSDEVLSWLQETPSSTAVVEDLDARRKEQA
tara:strand:- start:39 stop:413 length:375 start_codon:yes stop_codon:yes gene_type:complete